MKTRPQRLTATLALAAVATLAGCDRQIVVTNIGTQDLNFTQDVSPGVERTYTVKPGQSAELPNVNRVDVKGIVSIEVR